jgi:hypothetical protein
MGFKEQGYITSNNIMILKEELEKLRENAILSHFNSPKTIRFALNLDTQFLPHRKRSTHIKMT